MNVSDFPSFKHIRHNLEFAELPADAGVTLQLHSLGKALTNLWNILDTTMEERQPYGQINIFSLTSANGMLGPGSLRLEKIQQVNPRQEPHPSYAALILLAAPFKRYVFNIAILNE